MKHDTVGTSTTTDRNEMLVHIWYENEEGQRFDTTADFDQESMLDLLDMVEDGEGEWS